MERNADRLHQYSTSSGSCTPAQVRASTHRLRRGSGQPLPALVLVMGSAVLSACVGSGGGHPPTTQRQAYPPPGCPVGSFG